EQEIVDKISCALDPEEESWQKEVEKLLQELRDGKLPTDDTGPSIIDDELNLMNYKDFPALQRACAALMIKSKDKKLDVVFRARITAMVGVLNLYLHPELSYTWHEASMIVSRSEGKGTNHARNLQAWIHQFIQDETLPMHHYGRFRTSILQDEDFTSAINLHLQGIAKNGYFKAQDIVDFIATPEMQEKLHKFGAKKKQKSVSEQLNGGYTP
ncbi:hypothetical protein C0992_010438, partial [Termitomyces sp. T32_za158]